MTKADRLIEISEQMLGFQKEYDANPENFLKFSFDDRAWAFIRLAKQSGFSYGKVRPERVSVGVFVVPIVSPSAKIDFSSRADELMRIAKEVH